LGTLFFQQGRILPGYLFLHQAVEKKLDDPELRLTLGLASLTAARTTEARTQPRRLSSASDNGEALLLLVYTSVTLRTSKNLVD